MLDKQEIKEKRSTQQIYKSNQVLAIKAGDFSCKPLTSIKDGASLEYLGRWMFQSGRSRSSRSRGPPGPNATALDWAKVDMG